MDTVLTQSVQAGGIVNEVQTTLLQRDFSSLFWGGGGYQSLYCYLTGDHLVVAKSVEYFDFGQDDVGEDLVFINNDPLEAWFRTTGPGQDNAPVGSGKFYGYYYSGGRPWIEDQSATQTYLGEATITVPAGTFDCVGVRNRTDWDDGWSTGYVVYTIWTDPDVGWVAGNVQSVNDSDPGAVWTIYEFDFTLTSTNVSPSTVTISALDSVAGEPSDNGTYRISRSAPTTSALTVNFDVDASSTAGRGNDYVLKVGSSTITGHSVTIPTGQSFVDVTLEVVDDALVEWNETATLKLTDGAGYDVGTPGNATVTITSEEKPDGRIVVYGNFGGAADVDIARRDVGGRWLVTTSQGNTQGFGGWSTAVRWHDVQSADVNGDGTADILGRTDTGAWWAGISNGSSFANQFMGAWSTAVNWNDVHVGDVNGDGKADIVGRTDTGAWWAGISDGSSFANQFMGAWSAAVNWNSIQLGDVNGDGKDDILGRTDTGAWWVGISNGSSFTNQFMGVWSPAVSWRDVSVGDVDGGGREDLLGCVLGADQWWVGISQPLPTDPSLDNQLWT